VLEVERILTMDFASTQAHAMEVAPLLAVRGPDGGRYSKAPKRFTSPHRRWGGQDVPPTCADPRHRHCHHATSGVRLLALVRPRF
jgi:hypothetical protein